MYSEFESLGIHTSCIDTTQPDSWEAALRPETKVFYVESVSNPLLEVSSFWATTGIVGASVANLVI